MADLPRFNFDADETNANWIQILHARHRGQMHPLDPKRKKPEKRHKAWRVADQERAR
jgi:hypothetical protein